MSDHPRYWFPAKRHGWGWGIPSAWQGWCVLIGFVVLLAGAFPLLQRFGGVAFSLYMLVLSAILVAVCWLKGEPPGRRGDSS